MHCAVAGKKVTITVAGDTDGIVLFRGVIGGTSQFFKHWYHFQIRYFKTASSLWVFSFS